MFFFFQAEDGIRYWSVTGVQTCALPISLHALLGVLLLALFHEEDKAGGNAGAAGQATEHVQPAQQPVAEVLQVQAGEEGVEAVHGRARRGFPQQRAPAGLEVGSPAPWGGAVGGWLG